jgi:hypothetical protein
VLYSVEMNLYGVDWESDVYNMLLELGQLLFVRASVAKSKFWTSFFTVTRGEVTVFGGAVGVNKGTIGF